MASDPSDCPFKVDQCQLIIHHCSHGKMPSSYKTLMDIGLTSRWFQMPPCFDWSGVTVQADQVHNHIDQDGSEAAKNTAHCTSHIAQCTHCTVSRNCCPLSLCWSSCWLTLIFSAGDFGLRPNIDCRNVDKIVRSEKKIEKLYTLEIDLNWTMILIEGMVMIFYTEEISILISSHQMIIILYHDDGSSAKVKWVVL